ncbi:cilia- and flagella-associated protein 77 [Polymixia lowei]
MNSPHVGVVRKSMLVNPLLIRASLGQSQSRGLMCPGPDFVYGTSTTVPDGGVAEALSAWRVQSIQPGSASSRLQTNFLSLNREGVKSGVVTAKELSQYRAQEARTSQNNPSKTHQHRSPAQGTNHGPGTPDVTFGVKTRPSSPLSDLLAHEYQHRWLEEQQNQRSSPTPKHLHKVAPALDTFRGHQASRRGPPHQPGPPAS